MHVPVFAASILLLSSAALADVGRVEVVGKPGARCSLNGQTQVIGAQSRARFEKVAIGGYTMRCTANGTTVAGPVMVRAGRKTRTSMANLRNHMLKARKKTATPGSVELPPPRMNEESPGVTVPSQRRSSSGPTSPPRVWHRLPGRAVDIAAHGKTAWVLGTNRVDGGHGIYRWTGKLFEPVIGGAMDIAVGPSGTPWVVNNRNEIFQYNGRLWDRKPGLGQQIAVGADGSVWLLGMGKAAGGHDVYRWNGMNWVSVGGHAQRIAVDPHGMAWVVNAQHQIFRYTGQGWAQVPGAASDVSIGTDGSVWFLGVKPTAGGLEVMQLKDGTLELMLGGLAHLAAVSTENAWGVNTAQQIYWRP